MTDKFSFDVSKRDEWLKRFSPFSLKEVFTDENAFKDIDLNRLCFTVRNVAEFIKPKGIWHIALPLQKEFSLTEKLKNIFSIGQKQVIERNLLVDVLIPRLQEAGFGVINISEDGQNIKAVLFLNLTADLKDDWAEFLN